MKIFKGIISFVAVCLLALVWWSSNLIEEDLKALHAEIGRLQKETVKLSEKFSHNLASSPHPENKIPRPHLSSLFPNLLKEDPYYVKTLPTLLGRDFMPKGIRKEALIGRPENLHPFNGFRDVSKMQSMCIPSLAQLQFGKFETMAPDLALKIESRPRADLPHIPEYWVHLRDDLYWQPLNEAHFPSNFELAPCFFEKQRVTAHDFKFFFDAVMNPYISEAKAASLRSYFSEIEEFDVIDDYTFVVRWKVFPTDQGEDKIKYSSLSLTGSLQPLPRFVYQHFADGTKILEEDNERDTYRTNSIWAQNFSHHWAKNCIVSCGPYLFEGMTDEGIYFRRNSEYHNRHAVLTDGVNFLFKESPDAVWQDFKAGNLNHCILAPNQLAELDTFLSSSDYQEQKKRGEAIEKIEYIDRCFYYLGWNQKTDFFGSLKVRQALTYAIDRRRIIEQNLNQMAIAITGPFFPYSSAYDPSISAWPFNPTTACRLLEEEGWVDLDGDGIRDKMIDGKRVPFRFRLIYYVKSLSTKVIVDYIATSFRSIGIDCQPYGVDITDLSRQFDDKTFDAIFMGWKLGTPPDDPRQIWHSAGAEEKGSSNAIGFANPTIDTIIDRLNYETEHEKRTALYHAFHKIIHSENPYTFLYTPKVCLLYREQVKNLFIPRDRQDLIPGADIPEPNLQAVWIDDPVSH
ncbi:MAG: hypothetical protein S4CHLAM45_01130 [Chlamydiales bacterium]|nr:hypothetical protein [Chlamydiales bacterium]MCH9619434.1 hypothetical protein [Chlamydiales bacterium]MCH9622238.1 hypothetical protein [Chlamydiales bacterium]